MFTLKRLYTIYVRSKLEFNTPIWSPYIQKFVTVVIYLEVIYLIYLIIRDCLKYNLYEYLHYEFVLITLLKIINGVSELYFEQLFKYYQNKRLIRRKQRKITRKHHFKISQQHKSFFYQTMNLWNTSTSEKVSRAKIELLFSLT